MQFHIDEKTNTNFNSFIHICLTIEWIILVKNPCASFCTCEMLHLLDVVFQKCQLGKEVDSVHQCFQVLIYVYFLYYQHLRDKACLFPL